MVLSIFLSMISIFNNLYVIILRRKITKISAFISTYLLVCRRCISSQWIAEEIDEKKSPLLFLMNPEFHNKRTVLTPSFRPKRSGVEKSHTEAGRAPWWQEISRLSVSINSKAFAPISAGPPLKIRMSMSSIQSFSGGSTDQNAAPPPSFRRSERSVEISRRCGASPMVAEDLSAQRFNKLQSLYPHIGRSPARDDHNGRQPIIICDKPKGTVKKW